MKTQVVYDRAGKAIGRVQMDDHGNETAYSSGGRLLGRSQKPNESSVSVQRDSAGRVVARGADAFLFFENE
jgi:hypothetical protein